MSDLIGGWTDARRRERPSRAVDLARWVALNVGLGAMCSTVAFLVVRPFTNTLGLRGADIEPMLAGNYYASTLITEVAYVPLYLLILARVSRRHPESFRRRAVLWSLVLFVVPIPWVLAVTTPEGQAYVLFRLLFGLTAQPLPDTHVHAGARAEPVERQPKASPVELAFRVLRLAAYAVGLLIGLFLALWVVAAIVFVLAGLVLGTIELIKTLL